MLPALAIVLVIGLAISVPTARMTLVLAACLFLPGTGWARQMRLPERNDTITLAVVLSVCMSVTVGTGLAMSGTYSTAWGAAILGGITVAGFMPARAWLNQAVAALRQPARGIDEVAWAAWHSGVERRAEQARARQAAAAQQAIGQWITWYQLTQLRTSRQSVSSSV